MFDFHGIICHSITFSYCMQKATPKTRSALAMASPFFLSCRSSSAALAIGIAPCAGVQNKLNRSDCKRQCCSRATEQQKLLQLTNDLHKLQLVGRGWGESAYAAEDVQCSLALWLVLAACAPAPAAPVLFTLLLMLRLVAFLNCQPVDSRR